MSANESFIPFTQALYSQFGPTIAKSNFVISPLSIYTALSMLLAGSLFPSKNELLRVLHVQDTPGHDALYKSIANTLGSFSAGDQNKTLVQVNANFMQSGLRILDTYLKIVEKDFGAITKRSKIKELLPEGSLSPSTPLLLVNAIYFKGTWQIKFDKGLTKEANFTTLTGTNVKVQMMEREGDYKVANFQNIRAKAVKIPFQYYEMLILLPYNATDFPEVLQSLIKNPANLLEVLTSDKYLMEKRILKMPKFSLGGESIKMKSELQKMGLENVFSAKANFSGITGDSSLFVSDLYHQAMIEVDEEGAVAAAATADQLVFLMLPSSFIIDHPFLFFIITQTGMPIFMGQVVEPKEKINIDEALSTNSFPNIRVSAILIIALSILISICF